jgi:penicillin-binding protein 1A
MVRAFSVIPNQGKLSNFYFIKSIMDRDGNEIFNSNNFNTQNNIEAFPWLVTLESNLNKPYYLNNYISSDENNIDPRITFLLDSVLKEFMQRGSAGRLTADLNRTDFGGKTGTTNEAISTWFSGYHNELVTSVWVGKDNFQSLGDNEFGSTVALPIWIEYMKPLLKNLDNKEVNIPENISFVRVNKDNGLPAKEEDKKTYFELFLQENIID